MKNRLKLLEVTSDGVGYYDLDERIDFLSTVSKIGVRFLTADRTPKVPLSLSFLSSPCFF